MYTAQELLGILADNPYESTLGNLDNSPRYISLPTALGNLDSIGTIAIEVAEGLLLIPYDQILLGHGWEQLLPEHALIIPQPDTCPAIYDQYTGSLATIESTLLRAITTTPRHQTFYAPQS